MGIPTLRQNERGIYEIYWTDNGRGKRVSTRTRDLDAAKSAFATWLTASRPAIAEKNRLTVGELWAEYDAKHLSDSLRVADPASVRFSWKNLRERFSGLLPIDITPNVTQRYCEDRYWGDVGRYASEATVRKELAALRACLNWCADRRRKLLDPNDLPYFDLPPAGAPRGRWLRTDEYDALESAAAALRRKESWRLSRVERFIAIAFQTGARKRAILELTWDRVDMKSRVIHFAIPGRRATKKLRASVPISGDLWRLLDRAYAERISDFVLDTPSDVWSGVKKAAKHAGLNDVSPHTLRHSAATHMARNGVPLWQIAKILGNTLAMVERVYAKWCPDSPETTVDRISGGLIKEVA